MYAFIFILTEWRPFTFKSSILVQTLLNWIKKIKGKSLAKRYVYFYPINEDKSLFKYCTAFKPIDNESAFYTRKADFLIDLNKIYFIYPINTTYEYKIFNGY